MVNFSAVAALPSRRWRLLFLTCADSACLGDQLQPIASKEFLKPRLKLLPRDQPTSTWSTQQHVWVEEEKVPPSLLLHLITMVPPGHDFLQKMRTGTEAPTRHAVTRVGGNTDLPRALGGFRMTSLGTLVGTRSTCGGLRTGLGFAPVLVGWTRGSSSSVSMAVPSWPRADTRPQTPGSLSQDLKRPQSLRPSPPAGGARVCCLADALTPQTMQGPDARHNFGYMVQLPMFTTDEGGCVH